MDFEFAENDRYEVDYGTEKEVGKYWFEGNDLLDSRTYGQGAGDVSEGRGSSLIKPLWDRAVRLSNPLAPYMSCEIDGELYAFLWTRKSFAGVEDEVTAIREAIQTFRAALAKKGASYALVFAPTKYRVLHERCVFPEASEIAVPEANLSALPDQISAFAHDADIPFLDLTEALKRADQIPWFWGDTHWNEAGHSVAAQAISNWIR